MRIGLIAPPWVAVPPAAYGGTEVVVDDLARALSDLGHDVRLFTVGESTCPVARASLFEGCRSPMGTSVEEAAHVLAAYESLDDVDVIHDHTILGPLVATALRQYNQPVVMTHHGPFTPEYRRIVAAAAQRHASIAAISRDQAARAEGIPIAAVIHHGIDLGAYQPGSGGGEYLLFVGRMSPDKGVATAVRVAHRAGRRLVLASKIREAAEHQYFDEVVRPMLGADDQVIVEPSFDVRLDLLQHAEALVNPIDWPEPFGLVMVEALAAGLPVLTFGEGAAPEIVDDGQSGFLCVDENDMVASVAKLDTIDRLSCRRAAEDRFGMHRMAGDYLRLYHRVIRHREEEASSSRPRDLRVAYR